MKGQIIERIAAFVRTKTAHVLLLVLGTIFILTDAFHGNIWFDESYSVALVNHSFTDIWIIGASDVHPVLYYWMLWVVRSITGGGILIYRLFSVAGAVAMATLGLTHLRKDFGITVGLLFSFFALFTPYVANMAVEIRMYSWCTFAVMVACIYAYRIFVAGRAPRIDDPTSHAIMRGGKRHYRVPLHYWIIFFIASLSSAYLHYFGLLTVFIVNILLGGYLVVHYANRAHDLARYMVSALVQVLLYVPWLIYLYNQLQVVSTTYWANFMFPVTLIELGFYPWDNSQVAFGTRGSYGPVVQIALIAVLSVLAVLVLVCAIRVLKYREHSTLKESFTSYENMPIFLCFIVYLGLFLVAGIASALMGSLMLYYRYVFCAIGPFLLMLSFLLAKVKVRGLICSVCAALLVLSCITQVLSIQDDYSSQNKEALDFLEDNLREGELILSSDIGIEGVTAVLYPDTTQYYLDWQKGSWGKAYDAYAPALVDIKNWDEKLGSYTGRFLVIGQGQTDSNPKDLEDILKKDGVKLIYKQTNYRPYERTFYTVAICVKES